MEVLSVIAVQVKCIQDGIKEETPTFDFMGEVSPRACLLSCCASSLTSSGDSHESNCWLLHHHEPGLCRQSRAAGESQGKFTISSCLTSCNSGSLPTVRHVCSRPAADQRDHADCRGLPRGQLALAQVHHSVQVVQRAAVEARPLRLGLASHQVGAGGGRHVEERRPRETGGPGAHARAQVSAKHTTSNVDATFLRDFNVPKIVADDTPVFLGLISDLFPNLDVPRKRDQEFEKAVKNAACDLKLQPEENFIMKIVQLEEILFVRHSVFVVGDAGTGKTQTWRTLFRTYQNLKKKPVYADLNPKACIVRFISVFISMISTSSYSVHNCL